MRRMLKVDITIVDTIVINVGLVAVSIIGIVFLFLRYPTKLERAITVLHRLLKRIIKGSEYIYTKYNLQSKLNKYIDKARKKAPQIEASRAKIKWVDETTTKEHFLKNGQLVINLHKSDNENRNIINATMAFVTTGYLKKAKSYIANYQKDAIDLFVCYDIVKSEKREIVDQFAQDYLKEAMTNDKIADFFNKFMDIDRAGLYFPVFLQELTFFGEKVFTGKRDKNKIYEQIKILVNHLYRYANRKMNEDTITDYNGEYSKFAIRIIGKSFKINTEGERVYKRNLQKLGNGIETLYLIGGLNNKDFVQSIATQCKKLIGFDILYKKQYSSIIKGREKDFEREVDTYLVVLRNEKVKTIHRK
jgi:hypothetical protein